MFSTMDCLLDMVRYELCSLYDITTLWAVMGMRLVGLFSNAYWGLCGCVTCDCVTSRGFFIYMMLCDQQILKADFFDWDSSISRVSLNQSLPPSKISKFDHTFLCYPFLEVFIWHQLGRDITSGVKVQLTALAPRCSARTQPLKQVESSVCYYASRYVDLSTAGISWLYTHHLLPKLTNLSCNTQSGVDSLSDLLNSIHWIINPYDYYLGHDVIVCWGRGELLAFLLK